MTEAALTVWKDDFNKGSEVLNQFPLDAGLSSNYENNEF